MNYSFRLKKHLPKSLFGRSVLILAIPIVMIQAIVSAIFIDRLYGDVTTAKTTDIAREINFILSAPVDTDLRALQARSQPLAITVRHSEQKTVEEDKYDFFDISGRYIIKTLRAELDSIAAIDLAADDRAVKVWLSKDDAELFVSFSRRRASAVNPHQLLVATALGFISVHRYRRRLFAQPSEADPPVGQIGRGVWQRRQNSLFTQWRCRGSQSGTCVYFDAVAHRTPLTAAHRHPIWCKP